MYIHKKYLRSYEKYFSFLKSGESFRLVVKAESVNKDKVSRIGFEGELVPGTSILPAPLFGPISQFNALGKVIKRKDLPMETAHRTVEWHWEEWNGPYETIERSDFRDVPYKRYPREEVSPPSEEIEVVVVGKYLVFASRVMVNKSNSEEANLHVANLFLEIFGGVEVVSRDLKSFYTSNEKKLNWQILPPGEYPWNKVKEKLDKIVDTLPEGNRAWARHRIGVIRRHKPDFHAVGAGGFYGYVVYGFTQKGLYVLETIRYGNATYVFKKDWEDLSRLTKAQVLNSGAEVQRIIHHPSWGDDIDQLLRSS